MSKDSDDSSRSVFDDGAPGLGDDIRTILGDPPQDEEDEEDEEDDAADE